MSGGKVRKRILCLNGPNLNLLGTREPEVYGRMTLNELNGQLRKHAAKLGCTLRFFQSNGEGELINALHEARTWASAVVFNPGAYTHYSYALRDAVSAIEIPVVEVHLSDIRKREAFRKISVIAPVCVKQISGLGVQSYTSALDFLCRKKV